MPCQISTVSGTFKCGRFKANPNLYLESNQEIPQTSLSHFLSPPKIICHAICAVVEQTNLFGTILPYDSGWTKKIGLGCGHIRLLCLTSRHLALVSHISIFKFDFVILCVIWFGVSEALEKNSIYIVLLTLIIKIWCYFLTCISFFLFKPDALITLWI